MIFSFLHQKEQVFTLSKTVQHGKT